MDDLSRYHEPVGELFPRPVTEAEWERYRLTDDQVSFYREHGYLAGVKMLDEQQLEVLRRDLSELVDPMHPGHDLFYEFNANESANLDQILNCILEARPRFPIPRHELRDLPEAVTRLRLWKLAHRVVISVGVPAFRNGR